MSDEKQAKLVGAAGEIDKLMWTAKFKQKIKRKKKHIFEVFRFKSFACFFFIHLIPVSTTSKPLLVSIVNWKRWQAKERL